MGAILIQTREAYSNKIEERSVVYAYINSVAVLTNSSWFANQGFYKWTV